METWKHNIGAVPKSKIVEKLNACFINRKKIRIKILMKKILISDSVDEKCTAILKSAGFEVDYKTDLSKKIWSKSFPIIMH